MRKDTGLEVSDRIEISYQVPAEWQSALDNNRKYICGETLTDALTIGDLSSPVLSVNDLDCRIEIKKK